ncbi:MAG TPA: FtsX-like permease family protein [Bacteroidota bacterium]|nr:FtsX-like permease family protein [Bacteroidota bacterium]
MIRFLFKGLLRDRSRSLFPFLTVFLGVLLVVFLQAWLNGALSSLVQSTAHFRTGHVRVMSRAYAKEMDQAPNDLALLGIDSLIAELKGAFPDFFWTPRIQFGGLLDIPDEHHETRAQAPVSGMGVDLLSPDTPEWKILNMRGAIVRGRVPRGHGEILVGDELAGKLRIQPGDTATLISSTMYGSMSVTNFVVVGTVRFGIVAMDKATMIADVSDIQQALEMDGGAGEILGFFADDVYHDDRASAVTAEFNEHHRAAADRPPTKSDMFSPVMGTLRDQSGLADYMDYIDVFSGVIMGVFLLAMSIVLWNAGLTGSLRRYGEIGLRLAVGEDRSHVYASMLAESLMIGLIGSLAGTAAGLAIDYYLQVHGFDMGALLRDSSMMLPDVIRARITGFTFVVGFLPGVLATFLGTAMSGVGIYQRQTSQLFKELET